MDTNEPTPPVDKSFAQIFADADKPEPRGDQLHRITWFIGDRAVGFELECLHEEMPERFYCDKETAEEDRDWFIECYAGDKTPLRDGIIESGWEGTGEDSELYWKYAGDPAHLEAAAGT